MQKLTIRIGGLGANFFGLKVGMEFGSLLIEKPDHLYRFGKIGQSSSAIITGEFFFTEAFAIKDDAIFKKVGSFDKWYLNAQFSEAALPTGVDAKLSMSLSAGQKTLSITPVVVKIYGFTTSPPEFSGSLIYKGRLSDVERNDADDPRYVF